MGGGGAILDTGVVVALLVRFEDIRNEGFCGGSSALCFGPVPVVTLTLVGGHRNERGCGFAMSFENEGLCITDPLVGIVSAENVTVLIG